MKWRKFGSEVLLLLLICILSISCSKEDKEWNILKWKMDGRAIGSDCEGGHRECGFLGCGIVPCDPASCRLVLDLGNLSIHGGNETKRIEFYKYRGLKIISDNKLDEYDHMIYKDANADEECREYNVDTLSKYKFTIIQLDTLDRIIAGLFSFTAINYCRDTVEIEDGYFKLTY